MSFLPTVPYADVAADVAALVGNSAPTTVAAEALRVKSYINMALRRAYAASPWWERYLIAAREVSLQDGVILRESPGLPDAMVVEGAGTTAANGVYLRDGDTSGKPRYTLVGGTALGDSIYWDGDVWIIGGIAYYFSFEDVATPDLATAWFLGNGTAPAPTVRRATWADVDAANVDRSTVPIRSDSPAPTIYPQIDTLMHVAYRDQFESGIVPSLPFVGQNNGYRMVGQPAKQESLFAIYKTTLPAVFGSGSGETAAVPAEWANYASHYAARQYQVSSRQGNLNPMVTIGFREVDEMLEDAKAKLDDQAFVQHLAKFVYAPQQFDRSLY